MAVHNITFADYLERRAVGDRAVRNFLQSGASELLYRRSWADLIRAMKAAGADEAYIEEAGRWHREYARASRRARTQQLNRGQSARPHEEEVGARVLIKAERADSASALFIHRGLTPVYIEREIEGARSFWFGNASAADLLQAVNAIPREWHA